MNYIKLTVLIILVSFFAAATAQQTKTFQSKAYGYNFVMSKEYKIMGDSVKPNYQDLNLAKGANVNVRITAIFTDTYDSASCVTGLSQLNVLKPADWNIKLQKAYAGARFKSYSLVRVDKHPGYRVDFETGKGTAVATHYIVNVYAKYYAYSIHLAHTDSSLPAAAKKDAADFIQLLNYFSITRPTKTTSLKTF